VTTPGIAERVAGLDWNRLAAELDQQGYARLPSFLGREECLSITGTYEDDARFRKRIVMERHGYGRGEYKYFAYPLPEPIRTLRTGFYRPLAAIANRWSEALRIETVYPDTHETFIERCHRAGQLRPTPLLFRYVEGDYNRLHQDLYGQQLFPFQVLFQLSAPGRDFTGGEFLLVEQRPRMQSRAEVVPLGQGDGVVFPVNHRPMRGPRGWLRVAMRHGVSRVRSGQRHTLGIMFHDAE
jgi:hypothetical protein